MPTERKSMTARWTLQVPDIPTDTGGQRVGSNLSLYFLSIYLCVCLTVECGDILKYKKIVKVWESFYKQRLVSYLSGLFTTLNNV